MSNSISKDMFETKKCQCDECLNSRDLTNSLKTCEICKYRINSNWNWYNWNNKTYHWECIKKYNEHEQKLYKLD